MKFLVTGAAGFIGFHLCKKLLDNNHEVIALDEINDYYDVNLKFDRLKNLGLLKSNTNKFSIKSQSKIYKKLQFVRLNLCDQASIVSLFSSEKIDIVCHLAAQAGVRYSLINPDKYIESNIVAFHNIIKACKDFKVSKFLYASSSSVYGNNNITPFNEEQDVSYPVSLYAATKRSNELLAHTYSYLYSIQTIGLRFFTVYGPWGRPDMAIYLFTKAIFNKKSIEIFNNGELARDFTYIDDVINGINLILEDKNYKKMYSIFNIGNTKKVNLINFIEILENQIGIKAIRNMKSMQPGDIFNTHSDISSIKLNFNYSPKISLNEGVGRFINWYKKYYKI